MPSTRFIRITQINTVTIKNIALVLGLGADNRMYQWSPIREAWELYKMTNEEMREMISTLN